MRIIFLDIDGVLSLSGDYSKRTVIKEGLAVPYMWNTEACYAFKEIRSELGLEIVLSSDWRSSYRLPDMREIFNANSLVGLSLIGYTPHNKEYTYASDKRQMGFCRSKEINEWLALHGVREWVAIDDLPLHGLDNTRFVRCPDPGKGILGSGIVDKIREVFNES
jgi:hypothetical protein